MTTMSLARSTARDPASVALVAGLAGAALQLLRLLAALVTGVGATTHALRHR